MLSESATTDADTRAAEVAALRLADAAAIRRTTLEILLFDRHITRAEMCRRADLCPVSVIHWIRRGDPRPSPRMARRVHATPVTTASIAAALGVSVEAFSFAIAGDVHPW